MFSPADRWIERALNAAAARACAESMRARELLHTLAGHRIRLEALGTPWTTVLESTGTRLLVAAADPAGAAADVTVSGTPLALLALLRAQLPSVQQRAEVHIEGDAERAQRWSELLPLLLPDPEQLLAAVLGRSGAHLAVRGLRDAAAWTRAAAWTSMQNLSEYLAHERGDLVPRAEAEHFLRGVDELREQLDRIEARVQLLAHKLR